MKIKELESRREDQDKEYSNFMKSQQMKAVLTSEQEKLMNHSSSLNSNNKMMQDPQQINVHKMQQMHHMLQAQTMKK